MLDGAGYAVVGQRVRRRPSIRAAASTDAAALADLAAATFPLACPPDTTLGSARAFVAEHLSAERFSAYLRDPDRTVLVAEDATGLVGYTMLVAGEPYDAHVAELVIDRPTIELSKCYALPRMHGTGTSRLLIDASLDAARSGGARSVWLGVNQQNARARAFYAKAGFDVVGTKTFQVGERLEDDYVLVRQLP
nr:GNAT family N-acetyltransferase [Beutenbergia cavernae]